jgi:hypothetical protein
LVIFLWFWFYQQKWKQLIWIFFLHYFLTQLHCEDRRRSNYWDYRETDNSNDLSSAPKIRVSTWTACLVLLILASLCWGFPKLFTIFHKIKFLSVKPKTAELRNIFLLATEQRYVFIKQNCAKYNEQKGITCQQSIRSDHTQKEKERIKPDYCLHDIINGSVLKRKEEIYLIFIV